MSCGLFVCACGTKRRISVNVKNVLSMCFVMFMPEVFFCGHLWFIMVLIMCFMLFFVVNNMFKNRLFSAGAAVVIFAAAMLFKRLDAYAVIGNLRFDDPWRICTAMVSFLFFEFGYLAKKNGIIEKIQQKSAVFSAFLLCVCAALTAFAFYINKVVNIVQNVFPLNANPAIFILGSFSGTFMTVAAAVLLEKIGVIKKALSKYGQKSLQIYLTQNWFIVCKNSVIYKGKNLCKLIIKFNNKIIIDFVQKETFITQWIEIRNAFKRIFFIQNIN